MANTKDFKFNLITPVTVEEIKVIEERDNTTVNSFVLIFVGALVFFILSIINVAFLEPAVANSGRAVDSKKNNLIQFSAVRALNGEFVVKARALSPLLDLDIKPDKLVEIVNNLVNSLQNQAIIDSFGRARDGSFNIQVLITDLESLNLIKTFFDENKDIVSNLFINEVADTPEGIHVTLVFKILV